MQHSFVLAQQPEVFDQRLAELCHGVGEVFAVSLSDPVRHRRDQAGCFLHDRRAEVARRGERDAAVAGLVEEPQVGGERGAELAVGRLGWWVREGGEPGGELGVLAGDRKHVHEFQQAWVHAAGTECVRGPLEQLVDLGGLEPVWVPDERGQAVVHVLES